jgi:hypothetical protein
MLSYLAAFIRQTGTYQLSSHAAAWFGIAADGVNSNILSAPFRFGLFHFIFPGHMTGIKSKAQNPKSKV